MRRGPYTLAMNFAARAQEIPVTAAEVVVATHDVDAAARRAAPARARGSAAPMSREVWPGRPFPLGATWDGEATNFSLFSEHAERVELCLFDDDGNEERVEVAERTRTTGTATCRASGPASATATASTGPTSPSRATASTRPSC